ncbi:integrase, partial [Bacteroides ovatus]
MPSFPKQAANSLVTETSQYFVFFCRSVCSAILAKCLIINVLRLIIFILLFIEFLKIN